MNASNNDYWVGTMNERGDRTPCYNDVPDAIWFSHGRSEAFQTKQGEKLWTRFSLSEDHVWTLGMGVVGDATRTSTVVAEKPFMGLVPESTTSWAEEEYSECNVNTCWELYGVKDEAHFPSTGSRYDITITTTKPNAIDWMTKWNPELENGGCADTSISEKHNDTAQVVTWIVDAPHKSPL